MQTIFPHLRSIPSLMRASLSLDVRGKVTLETWSIWGHSSYTKEKFNSIRQVFLCILSIFGASVKTFRSLIFHLGNVSQMLQKDPTPAGLWSQKTPFHHLRKFLTSRRLLDLPPWSSKGIKPEVKRSFLSPSIIPGKTCPDTCVAQLTRARYILVGGIGASFQLSLEIFLPICRVRARLRQERRSSQLQNLRRCPKTQ